jgi:hypothetical protein
MQIFRLATLRALTLPPEAEEAFHMSVQQFSACSFNHSLTKHCCLLTSTFDVEQKSHAERFCPKLGANDFCHL